MIYHISTTNLLGLMEKKLHRMMVKRVVEEWKATQRKAVMAMIGML